MKPQKQFVPKKAGKNIIPRKYISKASRDFLTFPHRENE